MTDDGAPHPTIGDVVELRRRTKTLSHVACFYPHDTVTLTGQEETAHLEGWRVEPAIFEMLGVQPLLGRLAAIGIYGTMAYAVAQRTREIGIRMALGARRSEVMRLVLGQSALVTALGVALGISGGAALTRHLEGMLFGLTPLDPATFLAVSVLFTLVAALASYVPARRATRVDPLIALRDE